MPTSANSGRCGGLFHRFNLNAATLAVTLGGMMAIANAQTLLHQEGFNTDGEKANPPRYTTTGRDVFEVPRIVSELGNADQKGPIYWAHNFEVSFVGIPEIPARRMILAWNGVNDTSVVSQDFLNLFVSSAKWLVDNKANATVVVAPDVAAIGGLADALIAAGFTVTDDDSNIGDDAVTGDLLIHAGVSNASRFARSAKPVIVMNAPDYDDMLVGSIGSATTFEPGPGEITAAGHPAAGGKTGTFDVGTGDLSFQLAGRFLPVGATTLATVVRRVPPAVTRLSDVDDLVAGAKQGAKTTGQVTAVDFADGSPGSWFFDNPLPGGEAGNWGLQVTGKLNVTAAGTFSVAVGVDDGARLRIDLDKNGLSASDTIIEDFGPHAFLIQYADVTFPANGTYDFEIISYNSGGGGSLEFSVAKTAGGNLTTALDSGDWDLVGADDATSAVKAQGMIDVSSFVATGATTDVKEPLIVLLNGPTDTPPGFFYGGGPFVGFEGAGFFAASGLNKWTFPDGQNYRTVRLNPVDVTGQKDVKLTIALAGTSIDFEDSDFLDIVAYPNGVNSTPVVLAHFRGVQNGVQPWLADQKENYVRRLTKQFTDFQYPIPTNATQLVIEIRGFTSWWNEIHAFDNIRITAGNGGDAPSLTIRLNGGNVMVEFGGVLQSAASITGPWTNVQNANSPYTIQKADVTGTLFLRARAP